MAARRNRSRRRPEECEWAGLYAGFCPGGVSLRRRPSLSATRCRAALATYPGTERAAFVIPCWSCSGRGLPSEPCHHGPWWSLTPPFHPYRPRPAVCFLLHFLADRSGWALPTALPCGARTFLGALSRDATVWPTHSREPVYALPSPDSAVRTMMHVHSGQCTTSSGAAFFSSARSVGASVMRQPPHVPCWNRPAPVVRFAIRA